MKKSSKNTEKQADKKNSEGALQKDFAHYPPVSTKQVKPHAHKKSKTAEQPEQVIIKQPRKTSVNAEKERTVNESHKIVNSVDESYSDGSGGGFEATEQVND